MKKYFLTSFMALLLALSVSACNRSDDDVDTDTDTDSSYDETDTDMDEDEDDSASGTVLTIDEMVKMDSPDENETISSPVEITGKARGSMYFEGVFPVEIEDASGKVIGTGQAKVGEGENWMTEDWVDFTSEITFTKPATGTTGYIVLKKDNPSGDMDNDMEKRIPVKF